MIKTDIAIIGGGASGLFAAATIAYKYLNSKHANNKEKNTASDECIPKIIIFEKMPRCGRKIGLTGKGRCNLTNTCGWEEFSTHIHPNARFFKSAFYACSNNDVMSFFEQAGLKLIVERGNRVYPASMHASDVTDTLVHYIKKSGIEIINNCSIKEINQLDSKISDSHKEDNIPITDNLNNHHNRDHSPIYSESLNHGDNMSTGRNCDISYSGEKTFKQTSHDQSAGKFILIGENQNIIAEAKCVIITTGGLSYQSTGSTGDGYKIAEVLGHKITKLFPSLTALKPKGLWAEKVSLKNVEVTLSLEEKSVATEFGDLDFTDGGIEGPIGYKVSRRAVEALNNNQKVSLKLDMKPALSHDQLVSRILREYSNGNNTLHALLSKLLPKDIIPYFIDYLKKYPRFLSCKNKQSGTEAIAEALKNWQFQIIGNVGYERAVVTAGGISLKEISPKTLESKLIPGLYFAGEILDMDCDTGGYNLQMAFSTGALAAENAYQYISSRYCSIGIPL